MRANRNSVGLAVLVCLGAFASQDAAAQQGCDDPLFEWGGDPKVMNTETGEYSIVFVATAGVAFDDVDAYNDAREEALAEAKAMYSAFLQEDVSRTQTIEKMVDSASGMKSGPQTPEQRTAVRIEQKKKITNFVGSTGGVIRGFVPLGTCIIKGKEVRVAGGVKSSTIEAAGAMSEQTGESIAARPAPTRANTNSGKTYSGSSDPNSQGAAGAGAEQAVSQDGNLRKQESTSGNSSRIRNF